MAETTTLRLMAAAKEFNIGKETLVDFLVSKGFSKDELKPTSKLTEDMYRSLQQEFAGDKVAKIKSDAIDLPKGSLEAKKKKEEETQQPQQQPQPLFKKEIPIIKKQVKEETPVVEETPVRTPPVADTVRAEPEVTRVEAPELEGPKVVNKIDLSSIDSSTRPKRSGKKADKDTTADGDLEEQTGAQTATRQAEGPAGGREDVTAKEATGHPAAASEDRTGSETGMDETAATDEHEIPPVIENIKAEKLEGPKILGKIDLPSTSDTRPKPPSEEKRKRKRIPIEKRDQGGSVSRPAGGSGPGGNQHGGGGQYGGQQGGNPRQPGQNRPPLQRRGTGGPGQGHGGGPSHGGGNRRPDPRHAPREAKEIDKKEIQEKIRQTQAKLAGAGGRGKSLKAKYRRAKREEMAEQAGGDEGMDSRLQVTEFISVSELANLMDVSYAEVIGKCMSLGMMVSINQRLEADVIELVAGEFGYTVEFIGIDDAAEMEEEEEQDDPEEMVSRSPVVTIMGHVDHGKTSLLDYIRSANVVAGEAGGITQHIGAYQVTTSTGKKITFLDTPGHEAFTAMRARGAKAADVAVIVVAADDAVMPQTKEAISHAQAAGLPMVFAINKIDRDGANPEKIKEQLAGMNILVEDWGGKFQSQEISAKKGLNIDLLLEKIGLEAELLDLKANPEREASGSVIEASLDKGRGYVATVLVQSGTLANGDVVVSGQYFRSEE